MNKLQITGTQVLNNIEMKIIEGGFGENQKCMLANDIAKQHEVETKYINKIINNNINRFGENDLKDFLSSSQELREFAKENGLITNNRVQNIFLLSERGYTKLVAMMDNSNEKKWEVMDRLIDGYFKINGEKSIFPPKQNQVTKIEEEKEMNNLMMFENRNVEVFELDGQVLFNPRHVGECLELGESAVRMAIKEMNQKQVIKLTNLDVNNIDIRKLNNAGENFLTESGVYKLIFKSRKKAAERFQDWVTDEVLPSIRKTGQYNAVKQQQEIKQEYSQEDIMMYQLQEQKKMKERLNKVENETEKIKLANDAALALIGVPKGDWKKLIKTSLWGLACKYEDREEVIRELYEESYRLLEKEMKINLDIRLKNRRLRAIQNGALKSKADKFNRLDVIGDDAGLIAAFKTIVSRVVRDALMSMS